MTNDSALDMPRTGLRTPGPLRKRLLPLFLVVILLFTVCTQNNCTPQAVVTTVIGALVGEAASEGILALTGSRILATVASMVAGNAANYILNQVPIRCKQCNTTETYQDLNATEGEPVRVGCGNPSCSRHSDGGAYLVVFSSPARMTALLPQCVKKLPPTCLLSKEDLGAEGIRLTWHSENAKSATLNGESVRLNGSKIVKPTETTAYILKVMNRYGREQDNVTVEGQALPPVVSGPNPEPDPPPPSTPPVTPSTTPPDPRIFVPAGQTIAGILEEPLQTNETYPGHEFHLNISQPVYIGRNVAIPEGSRITGRVIESVQAGRVEGKARLSLAFERLDIGPRSYNIAAVRFTREATASIKKGVAKAGVGAAIGAGVGAIFGGKKGAAKGAAAGGAAGAGVALATRGEEVRLQRGERMQVRLIEPIRIEVEQ